MNVAAYVEALQQDLANVAGIGDEAVAEAPAGSPIGPGVIPPTPATDSSASRRRAHESVPARHVEFASPRRAGARLVPIPARLRRRASKTSPHDHATAARDLEDDRRRGRPGRACRRTHAVAADHAQLLTPSGGTNLAAAA